MLADLKICLCTLYTLLAIETVVKIESLRRRRNMRCTKFQHLRACLGVNCVASIVPLVRKAH